MIQAICRLGSDPAPAGEKPDNEPVISGIIVPETHFMREQ